MLSDNFKENYKEKWKMRKRERRGWRQRKIGDIFLVLSVRKK
jgi:hypothetical protein